MSKVVSVSLAPLMPEHVSEAYVAWLNDPDVTRFTEARFQRHTIASTISYVERVNASSDERIWRVLVDGAHVGNVKLSAIDWRHQRANTAILIGNKKMWGRGIAPRAIAQVAAVAFGELSLHKLTAGIYAENVASRRAFEKAGFVVEAVRREHRVLDERRVDEILMARFAK